MKAKFVVTVMFMLFLSTNVFAGEFRCPYNDMEINYVHRMLKNCTETDAYLIDMIFCLEVNLAKVDSIESTPGCEKTKSIFAHSKGRAQWILGECKRTWENNVKQAEELADAANRLIDLIDK